MSMTSWAEKEVEIACKLERDCAVDTEESCDYGCECYKSALKAYKSLIADGHSGMSIKITKNILNRLIDGKPLTQIEDTDDVWRLSRLSKNCSSFQCTRMSSLFKHVYSNAKVKYTDVNRIICVDISNPKIWWSNGFVREIIDDMYPITMPYHPRNKEFSVYCEEFLTDKENGDYDTLGVLYVITPDGEKVEINRYFKDKDDSFAEIDKDEYEKRKAVKINGI